MFRRKNKEIEESKEIEENKEIEMEENTLQQLEPRQPKRTRNSEIAVFLYVFVGLFVICIVYLGYFVGIQSKDVINNPYNKRASVLQESIFRGSILSNDGTVLAYSSDNGDNTETRVYPYGKLFSHVVGRFTNTKTGIESSEEFTMLTSSVNLFEIMINQLSGTKSKGNNVVTTLDVDLQQVAYDALGSKQGAVVVMEASTGKILTMVSKPDYDPNEIATIWEELVQDDSSKSILNIRLSVPLCRGRCLHFLSYWCCVNHPDKPHFTQSSSTFHFQFSVLNFIVSPHQFLQGKHAPDQNILHNSLPSPRLSVQPCPRMPPCR